MTWTTSGSSGSTHFQPSIGQHGVAHSLRFQCSSGNAATRLGHSTPNGDEQLQQLEHFRVKCARQYLAEPAFV